MCTGNALEIRTAERAGNPDKPSEDRIYLTGNAVVLLDGATDPQNRRYSGGWLAEQAGQRMRDGLIEDPDIDLTKLVEEVIVDLADEFTLVPGDAPSATVAILRAGASTVDMFVLADSPIIVKLSSGRLTEVRDDRLAEISARYPRPAGLPDRSDPGWVARYWDIESHRNRPGGFWTVSASPEAAVEATTCSVPRGQFRAALLMSDGVSVLGDTYEPSGWVRNFDMFVEDPAGAIERTWQLEAGDAGCQRWPRSKVHDDKAIVGISLMDC